MAYYVPISYVRAIPHLYLSIHYGMGKWQYFFVIILLNSYTLYYSMDERSLLLLYIRYLLNLTKKLFGSISLLLLEK
ncbi:hypothetical protein [Orientia tsutsugamushi]|uniref:hypothetical protein n=1 Tax=Orientia tsutsugamushi TaxID=784 RepID=UPI0013A52E61|nr:hypothetical protein [Orientia tsutsugamushi]